MMNEKMEKVAQTIEKVMRAVFSEEFLELLCEEPFTLRDIAIQLMVECCKNAYDEVAEKHSVRFYLPKDDINEVAHRMQVSRTIAKIDSHREIEYEMIKKKSGVEFPGLLSKKRQQYPIS